MHAYQCGGGPRSKFALLQNGAADCHDTPLGRPSGNAGPDSSSFYGTQDPTWCPMQPACLASFSYPWFPKVASPDSQNWIGGTFQPPQPGFTMFRLPVLPLSSRYCTPSPFVNSTAQRNSNRTAYVSWATNTQVPTQCGDDMTLSIVEVIGPGYYTTPLGAGANATLSLGPDNNTVTCSYTLGSPLPKGLVVLNVTVVVTDGPIFASDDPLYTGNPSSPYWQIRFLNVSTTGSPTGSGSVLLSQALNSSVARSFTRVVDCVVNGVNTFTGFPFTLTAAQPYVVETYGLAWLPYQYPMPGNYTYSGPPTPAPTQIPTKGPTLAPTRAPTTFPTATPTLVPTTSPTNTPTIAPTTPTKAPTIAPSVHPTKAPTIAPSTHPTREPTTAPSRRPSASPSVHPTKAPTIAPSTHPTREPTNASNLGVV